MSMSSWAGAAIGAYGPRMGQAVLCCWCGGATSAGTFDWLGRFRCDDCAHKDAVNAMAQRLAAVEAEDRERAAMWGLDA